MTGWRKHCRPRNLKVPIALSCHQASYSIFLSNRLNTLFQGLRFVIIPYSVKVNCRWSVQKRSKASLTIDFGCVYHLSQVRNTFQYPLSKRVKQKKGVSNPPNQNSFAFIICKNHPESRLETIILRQKCDDKRTLRLPTVAWFIQCSSGLEVNSEL